MRALLMGGQACILYGAAEFSRDTDLAVLASPANLARLRGALDDLRAEVITVPPFEAKYLRRGHAVHFRCQVPEAVGMRVDVMTRMRGVDAFPKLWARRTSLVLPDGTRYEVMSLPDLVRAKKTQHDKDWPMALLKQARPGREAELAEGLVREEWAERQADARYWAPLKVELERLRHPRPPRER